MKMNKVFQDEMKKLRNDVKEARERAAKLALTLLDTQERLEYVKAQLANCTCGAKLDE